MTFYFLDNPNEPPRKNFVLFGADEPWIGCDKIWCDVCGVKGVRAANRPLAVTVKYIDELYDVEQPFTRKVVSRRFREAVLSAGLTGVEFEPAVHWRAARSTPRLVEFAQRCSEEYQCMWAFGQGGSIAKTSGVTMWKSCEVCGWMKYTLAENGIFIDLAQWDGSDFFQVDELPGPTILSQRAMEVLKAAELRGVGFSNLADYSSGRIYNTFPGNQPPR